MPQAQVHGASVTRQAGDVDGGVVGGVAGEVVECIWCRSGSYVPDAALGAAAELHDSVGAGQNRSGGWAGDLGRAAGGVDLLVDD